MKWDKNKAHRLVRWMPVWMMMFVLVLMTPLLCMACLWHTDTVMEVLSDIKHLLKEMYNWKETE